MGREEATGLALIDLCRLSQAVCVRGKIEKMIHLTRLLFSTGMFCLSRRIDRRNERTNPHLY